MTIEVFGSFSWSPNGNNFCYMAEKIIKDSGDLNLKYSKFYDDESFGERLQNVKEPVICHLNLISMKVDVIDFEIDSSNSRRIKLYPAQISFLNDETLVFMGIDVGSKKLGMTYIYCRQTAIYELELKSKKMSN